jgi:hypothetical protein
MERLAAKPTAGVPQACRGWSETIAAYRFFDNDEVQWGAILEPHWRQTEQRIDTRPPRASSLRAASGRDSPASRAAKSQCAHLKDSIRDNRSRAGQ